MAKYKGLSSDEVIIQREKHGKNSLPKQRTKGFIRRFFENLSDPIIRILLIALLLEVVFTFGKTNIFEVVGILGAILIATTVTTASEYGSERAFLKMETDSSKTSATVIREGKRSVIPSLDIVVGDIMLVSAGENVEADGILLEGAVDVDQSALNGESGEVHKFSDAKDEGEWDLSSPTRVYRGSIVTKGEAVVRVMRVGDQTFYGMVAKDVQSETRESPLKLRLGKLAGVISKIGYVVAALVGFIYLFTTVFVDNGFRWNLILSTYSDIGALITVLTRALTMMITVIVVAVPEGLPMMITVVLSANMKRMLKDNILVKKLVGIETAGSLNILFTDKTGTITEGKLSLDKIITYEGVFNKADELPPELLSILISNARLNTDVEVSDGELIGGNATDRAIAEAFISYSMPRHKILDKTPFSSEIKYSSVTLDNGFRLIKGAPEVIINRSKYAVTQNGSVVATDLSGIKDALKSIQSRGERVIAVAKEVSGELVFVALLVLKDKIRKDVREAVKSFATAGIQIVMLTGDNLDTAVHIAEECGFYKSTLGHVALSSQELQRMSDDEVKTLLPGLRVLARALPQDKTRLVRLSQELNLVVGMTGDGINDAPSLKLADVGFSMGSGSEIAKSAGDIVILDNSFRAISRTVLYGRTIFKSIRKFISFQLIMNLAACGITLFGHILGIDNPITIIQMLWVNIIMDTLGGLAFAGEPPLDYYMKEKPKRRDEPILSPELLSHVFLNGAFTLALLITFLVHPFFRSLYSSTILHYTAFYALFIFSGIFNSFTARSERLSILQNIGKNKPFILIMILVTVIQVFIIYFGGELFRSAPLTVKELFSAVILAATVLVFDLVRRIYRKLH